MRVEKAFPADYRQTQHQPTLTMILALFAVLFHGLDGPPAGEVTSRPTSPFSTATKSAPGTSAALSTPAHGRPTSTASP